MLIITHCLKLIVTLLIILTTCKLHLQIHQITITIILIAIITITHSTSISNNVSINQLPEWVNACGFPEPYNY